MRNISLVEVRSEIAAGTRGASLGVDALKVASLDKKSDFFSRFDPIRVADANSYLWKENKFLHAKYIHGVYEVVSGVFETIRTLRSEKKFPIILVGTEFWKGLFDWIKTVLLNANNNVHAEDLELVHLVDSEDEVLEILNDFYNEYNLSPNF